MSPVKDLTEVFPAEKGLASSGITRTFWHAYLQVICWHYLHRKPKLIRLYSVANWEELKLKYWTSWMIDVLFKHSHNDGIL